MTAFPEPVSPRDAALALAFRALEEQIIRLRGASCVVQTLMESLIETQETEVANLVRKTVPAVGDDWVLILTKVEFEALIYASHQLWDRSAEMDDAYTAALVAA